MSPRNGIVLPPGAEAIEREYRFLRELGRGGSAVVYLAEDRELRRKVAIKLIQAPFASDEEALQRFTREARTAAQLHHSNIVAVHAVKRLRGGILAMVMQYVAGGTLKDLIRREAPLPFATVERVLRDVAAALDFAHSRGIIHRDVKPENIFLDEESGTALLADFGIARSIDAAPGLTLGGVVLGTPAYMAPEQIDGLDLDGRADLYSLGAVGWEMLTGEAPWEGETLYSIIYNQKHRALAPVRTFRPNAPFRLWHTVETALQKEPDRRFRDARVFLEALDSTRLTPLWSRWVAAWRLQRRADPPAASPPPAPVVPTTQASLPAAVDEQVTMRWRHSPPSTAPSDAPADPGTAPAEGEPQAVAAEAEADARGADARANGKAVVPRTRSRLPTRLLWSGPLRLVPVVGGLLFLPALGVALFGLGQLSPPATQEATTTADLSLRTQGTIEFDSRPAPFPGTADSIAPAVEGLDSASGELPADSAALGADVVPPDSTAVVTDAPAAAHSATEVPEAPSTSAAAAAEPRPVERSSPRALAAGGMHTCTLLSTGEVLCWGGNSAGQLGRGATGRSPAPVRIEGIRFQDIATGVSHSCGLTGNGEALCWGNNQSGQLGNESSASRAVPTLVSGAGRYTRIQTGGAHTCALARQGEVFCWGDNRHGQLGDGTGTRRPTPVRAGSGSFSSLAVGWNHSCALDRFGQPFCWGANGDGQVGTGSGVDEAAPVPIASRQRFTQIVTGGSHTCALAEGGTAHCWGRNRDGQLGSGTTASQPGPTAVAGNLTFVTLTAGSLHTCGLTRGGEAFCWGRNAYGQLGDGTTADRTTPVPVEGGLRFSSLHSSGAHTCGITRGGEQYCWGHNVEGQLGDGTRSHRTRPVRVALPGT
jgi:serine/threonine protein kinase/alpha-tubulin suppressor-like RCC1 family protein